MPNFFCSALTLVQILLFFQTWTFCVYNNFWVNPEYLIFFGPVIFSFQTPAKNLTFPKHDTIFFFQLIGHFVSTHLWVDSECPTFFLARHFFMLTLVQFLMFFWTWNNPLFHLILAICVYSYLRVDWKCSISWPFWHHYFVTIFTPKNLLEIIYFFYYRWLENHQVDAGLLSENEYTIQRRKDVCAQMIELEKQGYYVVYLDES